VSTVLPGAMTRRTLYSIVFGNQGIESHWLYGWSYGQKRYLYLDLFDDRFFMSDGSPQVMNIYSPSPECPARKGGDEWRGEPSEALAKEG
jgi:hypothetical protein